MRIPSVRMDSVRIWCYFYAVIELLFHRMVCGYEMRHTYYATKASRKLQSNQITQTVSTRSKLECCIVCRLRENCTSGSYELSSNICYLSTLTSAELNAFTDENAGWISFSKDEWLLVFRAPKGIGGDVYQAYVNGTDVTTDDVNCINLTSSSCSRNYRHPIIDLWESAKFNKVRVAYYKIQAQDAYVDFDANGSNVTSWFRKEHILNSSWTNAITDSYNYFSVEGYDYSRRFYMSLNHGGCPSDRLYALAVTANFNGCGFDSHPSYPQFIYANTTDPGYPESGTGTDLADFMAIFVK